MEKKTNLYIYIYILDDNAPCLTPKLCIAIDSNYSLALQWPQKKSKTIHLQNLGAKIKSIMIYVEMVNLNSSLL